MLSCSVRFYPLSLALLSVQSSMEFTQPTWTCRTLLNPLRLVQQGTLSVWYWRSDWTPQLCTTTLCLQLVEVLRWQCKETSQHHSTVSIKMAIYNREFCNFRQKCGRSVHIGLAALTLLRLSRTCKNLQGVAKPCLLPEIIHDNYVHAQICKHRNASMIKLAGTVFYTNANLLNWKQTVCAAHT